MSFDPPDPPSRVASLRFTVTQDCVGCGACLATCPEAAFRIVRAYPPLVVLAERCTDCAECAEVCPVDACVQVPR